MNGSHLADFRAELARRGLQGFIVPRADEHLGEYVPPGAERLAWLTGFTGSAGLAVVLAEQAALFVDGRYVLQAAAQTDAALWERRHITEEPPAAWLAAAAPGGAHRLRPLADRRGGACSASSTPGVTMVPCEPQPDRCGLDRPAGAAAASGRAAPARLRRPQPAPTSAPRSPACCAGASRTPR